jgi:putative glutathione S-transferase
MTKVSSNWKSSIKEGSYQRKTSQFRQWLSADGSTGFKAESGRYHLYVSLACPWAHRTLVFRQLKGLVDHISVSVVHPDMHDKSWSFQHDDSSAAEYETTGDTLYQQEFMLAIYHKSDESYQGNITVPVLWDKQKQVIVSNESADIIRMFNSEFNHLTDNKLDLYPEHLQSNIDEVNDWVYRDINNGVYKTGFATNQSIYAENAKKLFQALQKANDILSESRYLTGNEITEADWRLWTTLVRFDSVYHTHFKCNLKLLAEFKHLYHFMLELYQMPEIANTVNHAHIKRHYYASHIAINPYGIVPLGHQQDWLVPSGRSSSRK